MTAACVESSNWGMLLKQYSQVCFLCCVSVEQESVDDLLAKEKEVESDFKELSKRELCEAQKQILSLQQELKEQKINCKCS